MSHELPVIDDIREIVEERFDIEDFLAAEQQKDLLRFTTAGSVDDGKSTLIGRLLYDSRSVYEDQIKAVTRSHSGEASSIDFAQLTDGLRAEREQGITIDVAYRFFATPKRKFIIADTPGHEQYTRNMVTGASTAELAIVLVDARKGILTQSRRHAFIASLLGIRHVVAAINKMDLVDFSEEIFAQHQRDLLALADKLDIPDLLCIPISALDGDNVVTPSERTPWYYGPTLLEHLESVPIAEHLPKAPFRLPVQRVIRPHQHFRGFAGQIASGTIKPGDTIIALPSGQTSRVQAIHTFDGELESAFAPQSITLTLEDEIDISRGDLIAHQPDAPTATADFEASLVWLHAEPFAANKTYLLKHASQVVKAQLETTHRLDIETLEPQHAQSFVLNEIGEARVQTSRPLIVDTYRDNRTTGSFILIDPANNATVGSGMVRRATHEVSKQPTSNGGVLLTLPHAELTAGLEESLLASGEDVVITGVQKPEVWRALLHAGLIVLVHAPNTVQIEIVTLNRQDEFTKRPLSSQIDNETILRELKLEKGTGHDDDKL
ncbi:sulfate adenylyltransferase subunit CysN [Alloacidobacterium dinghuense]|uniref:Sulfate adenylyltransferase subunit 1 n=1 Tax=Alloacidobacterium dinghuense TaxID=2763107 RepID=A0A7G8BE49_9BACT|nr:sulfate adenylyltransferase subunit CysN [Alloacidobacterium dinghuense]QNI30819.1 sulfate adenylyltransferase subunit CysN [Alloacidobacterium dinghuense]